jgi:DNA-binding LacI/PurR family transcriptional regulator
MADLARLSGVAVSTVSRALSGSPNVHPETRRRIEELARRVNYSINAAARTLRSRNSRTIAVVLPFSRDSRQHVTDPFFLSIVGSLGDALTERGYDMLLSRVDEDEFASIAALHAGGRAAGIIVIGQWHRHDQLEALANSGVPLVVWGARQPQQRYLTVGSDNVLGGELATRYLLRLGCRRIAFFGERALPEVGHRFDGYLAAHSKHRRRPPAELAIDVSFEAAAAEATIERFLATAPRLDGVFACSDLLAMITIRRLAARGLVVPDEVSVIGYDDLELAAHVHPPLTTIHQPIWAGSHELLDALLATMNGEPAQSKVLETTLIVRGSTRAPAQVSGPGSVPVSGRRGQPPG